MIANSIRLKLGLGFISLTIILMAIMAFVLHVQLRTEIEEQSFQAVENSGNRITAEILRQLSVAKTIANSIANHSKLENYDEQRSKDVIPSLIDIAGTRHIIAGGGLWPEPFTFNPNKERASLFWGRNGTGKLQYFDDYNLAEGAGYHNEEWYIPAPFLKTGQCYWSQSYIDPYSRQPIVTCTTSIFEKGKFIGATTIDVKLEGIAQHLKAQTTNTGGYAFIVDQNNTFISFPDEKAVFEISTETGQYKAISVDELAYKDPLFKPIADNLKKLRWEQHELTKKSIAYVPGYSSYISNKHSIDKDIAEQIQVSLLNPLHDLEPGELLLEKIQIPLAPVLSEEANVSVYHIPDTYWKLVFVTPRKHDNAIAAAIVKETMTFIMLPAAILLGLYWLALHSSVLVPIHALTSHIRKAGNKNQPALLKISSNTPQEFSELIQSYNNRTKQLNDALKSLSKMNTKLVHQAHHDHLTGLGNRRGYEEHMNALIDSSIWDNTALLMIDIDQFKIVNDTAGHLAGDRLLNSVSVILSEQLRDDDYLARLGGDEFVVLLKVANLEQAYSSALRLCQAVEKHCHFEGQKIFKVTLSVGVVHLSSIHPKDPGEALRHADQACYMAKDRGRNRVHIYTSSDEAMAKHEGDMAWVSEINHALDDDRFIIELQRIKPLNSNHKLHSAEVLVRLRDREGKIVSPGLFLPAAERFGLASKIDQRVVELAFQTIADNPLLTNCVDYISINLSSDSMQADQLADNLLELIETYEIPTEIICFEITETGVIRHLDVALGQLQRLRNAGIRIALDDFGTGMSSYGYLRDLPVDIVKIDGSFVKDIASNKVNRAFVRSIKDIANVMQLRTVAEFVEDTECEMILTEIGINYAQGYGIAKPMPVNDVINEIANTDAQPALTLVEP